VEVAEVFNGLQEGKKEGAGLWEKYMPLYQTSIDNPKKDNFHSFIFDKDVDKNTFL
jgi:hypothetical protein